MFTKHNIITSLIFIQQLSLSMHAMESNAFDEQLKEIVSTISLPKQAGSQGIAFDGGRIFKSDNGIKSHAASDKFLGVSYKHHQCRCCERDDICNRCLVKNIYTTYFDARPIEEVVLAHMHGQIVAIPKFIYPTQKSSLLSHGNYVEKLIEEPTGDFVNLDNHKSPPSLHTLALTILCQDKDYENTLEKCLRAPAPIRDIVINYLLYNPKAPITQPDREAIIQKYIPIKEQLIHQCFSYSLDICLKDYIEKKMSLDLKPKDLGDIQSMIESHLEHSGDITVPITHCILGNVVNYKLAQWLLQEKHGWYYVDTLLTKCFNNFTNRDLDWKTHQYWEPLFWRCLGLVNRYHLLKKIPHEIRHLLFRGYRYSDQSFAWAMHLIKTTKYTQDEINQTFLRTICNDRNQMQHLIKGGANNFDEVLEDLIKGWFQTRKAFLKDLEYYLQKYNNPSCYNFENYTAHKDKDINTLDILLEHGANPNKVFYRDKKSRKKCFLRAYCDDEKTVQLLSRILLHPQRIREQDEPTDVEYLKDLRIFSIVSLFDNGKDTGQQDLYHYAMRVYELAFECRKTNDFRPLRHLIINRYKQGKTLGKETTTTPQVIPSIPLKPAIICKSTADSFNVTSKIAAIRFGFDRDR